MKIIAKLLLMLILQLSWPLLCVAQPDSTKPAFTISGYTEIYYAYDFAKPDNHNRPYFIYSYNRHNEINLNLGLIKAGYQKERVRANLGLMTGTYANANLAAEPGVLKNIYEANAGVKISRKQDWWLDAGIFSSHIGFESAIGKDCWTLTRSLLADNSPYYESGVRISYTTSDGKWMLSGLMLNGWQRMQRINGNNTLAGGHQLLFKPSPSITLNSSSFIGSDQPDSLRRMRYFHNLYGIFQVSPRVSFTAGFDIGAQQKDKGSSSYSSWYAPVLIVKGKLALRHYLAARAEYYHDVDGVIISSGTPAGFRVWGGSLNYDFTINDQAVWRIEARQFLANDPLFRKGDKSARSNFLLTTSLAMSF